MLIPTVGLNEKVGLLYRPERYIGEFKDGLFDGHGTLYYDQGESFTVAVFSASKIVKVIKTNSKLAKKQAERSERLNATIIEEHTGTTDERVE